MFEENNNSGHANGIASVNLHRVTGTPAATDLIRYGRWRLTGHVLRKDSTDDARIALTWQPPG